MKQLLVVLLATTLFGAAGIVQADTILAQSTDEDGGNWSGAFWALSDTGFAQSGDTLTQTMYLESVTFSRGKYSTAGTAGELYLKVFTGATGGLGTFVGVSSNTVNFRALTPLADKGTWTFDSLALDKDTVYSYVVGLTNDSSDPDAYIRMRSTTDASPPLASGGMLAPDDTVRYKSPTVTVVASSVPEPATMGFLMLAGVGVFFRRKR